MVINTALGRKPAAGAEPIKSDTARIHAAFFYLGRLAQRRSGGERR
jgi:hypothetical protein